MYITIVLITIMLQMKLANYVIPEICTYRHACILYSQKILRDPIFEDFEVFCLTSTILSSNLFQVKD